MLPHYISDVNVLHLIPLHLSDALATSYFSGRFYHKDFIVNMMRSNTLVKKQLACGPLLEFSPIKNRFI